MVFIIINNTMEIIPVAAVDPMMVVATVAVQSL
jgi:hypothetical protein